MEYILNYLDENPFMFVATCDGKQPRVRPFTAKAEFEGKLYITTNNQKNVYKQMLANPQVEVCVSGKDGSWMRIEATLVHDSRREARVKMMEANPTLSSMYNVDDGLMEVLYLQNATATIYSFAEAPKVINF